MTRNVDDIHSTDTGFLGAMERLKKSEIGQENINIIEKFVIACRREELAKNTIIWYINYSTRLAQRLNDMGFDKTIDKLEQDDFDRLLFYLEEDRGLSQSSLRNYRKLAKKLYGWVYNGEPPRWIKEIKLKTIDIHPFSHQIFSHRANLTASWRHVDIPEIRLLFPSWPTPVCVWGPWHRVE